VSRSVSRLFCGLAARKHYPILRRHSIVASASGPRVDSAPPIGDDCSHWLQRSGSISGRTRAAHYIVSACDDWLPPYSIQQTGESESRPSELMARDDLCLVQVGGTQADIRFIAAQPGRWFTRLDRNAKRQINVGTRDPIRLPRNIVCASRTPHIDRNFACVLSLKRVGGRLGTPRTDASFETATRSSYPMRRGDFWHEAVIRP
jgi:hypothetical protein